MGAGMNSKLTAEQIRAIFYDKRLHRIIALDYGISRVHVTNLKAGRYNKIATELSIPEDIEGLISWSDLGINK